MCAVAVNVHTGVSASADLRGDGDFSQESWDQLDKALTALWPAVLACDPARRSRGFVHRGCAMRTAYDGLTPYPRSPSGCPATFAMPPLTCARRCLVTDPHKSMFLHPEWTMWTFPLQRKIASAASMCPYTAPCRGGALPGLAASRGVDVNM